MQGLGSKELMPWTKAVPLPLSASAVVTGSTDGSDAFDDVRVEEKATEYKDLVPSPDDLRQQWEEYTGDENPAPLTGFQKNAPGFGIIPAYTVYISTYCSHLFFLEVLLDDLEKLHKGIARMKELTLRTTDYLVSFGECLSTRIFAAYLNKVGAKARQRDPVTGEEPDIVEFYRNMRWNQTKGWIAHEVEENYEKMVEICSQAVEGGKEFTDGDIVKKVLGKRSGHVIDLGRAEVPPSRKARLMYNMDEVNQLRARIE